MTSIMQGVISLERNAFLIIIGPFSKAGIRSGMLHNLVSK